MPHPADFVDAHHRHRADAELLFEHDRWANADQQELWPIFQSFVAALEDVQYLDQLPPGEPFADWSHHDRYAHGGYCGRTDVETHRNAADAVGTIVESARQNGLL